MDTQKTSLVDMNLTKTIICNHFDIYYEIKKIFWT